MVAAHLGEMDHFGKKQVTAILKSLKDVLSFRNLEELKSIYNEVKQKQIERKLFIDTIMMSGTNPAIMFAKEMIMSNQFSLIEAAEVIMPLPHNIKTPTASLIEEIFQLIKSPVVTSSKVLKANANIAFATIINRACFPHEEHSAVCPKEVFGEMCSPSHDKITREYIPHLVSQLHSDSEMDVQTAIMALGTIGHQSVVSVLIPYIEGKALGRHGDRIEVRKLAIYSLAHVSYQHRNILLPIYAGLVHNPDEA